MTEFQSGMIGTIGLFSVVLYSFFWWLGGRGEKFLIPSRVWRRWVAPIFLPLSIVLLAWYAGRLSAWHFAAFGTYKALAHIGYGAGTARMNWPRRVLWGFMAGLAALPYAMASHHWIIFSAQVGIAVTVSVGLGVFNELDAPREEGALSGAASILVPFMAI